MFDLLLQSQRALSAEMVARELGTSVDGVERLLDVLVGIEILEVETVEGTGEVHITKSDMGMGVARGDGSMLEHGDGNSSWEWV